MIRTRMTPGLLIRQARWARNWSQTHAAVNAGIDPAYFGQLERDRYSPTIKTMQKVAAGLGMEFHYEFRKVAQDD